MIKHKILTNKGIVEETDLTPMKAIRLKCYSCSNWQWNEVKLCTIQTCELFPFRLGKVPGRKPISEERKKAMGERLQKSLKHHGKYRG